MAGNGLKYCDFCCAPHPVMTCSGMPDLDLSIVEAPGEKFESTGDWWTCEPCGELVRRGAAAELIARCGEIALRDKWFEAEDTVIALQQLTSGILQFFHTWNALPSDKREIRYLNAQEEARA